MDEAGGAGVGNKVFDFVAIVGLREEDEWDIEEEEEEEDRITSELQYFFPHEQNNNASTKTGKGEKGAPSPPSSGMPADNPTMRTIQQFCFPDVSSFISLNKKRRT